MELSHSLLFSIGLVACYLAVLILIAEKLKSLFSTDGEITRKVVHIGTGNVILFAWWLNIPAWVGISAAILAAIIAILSYFFPILPSLNSVGRRSWGTFFMLLVSVFSWLIFGQFLTPNMRQWVF